MNPSPQPNRPPSAPRPGSKHPARTARLVVGGMAVALASGIVVDLALGGPSVETGGSDAGGATVTSPQPSTTTPSSSTGGRSRATTTTVPRSRSAEVGGLESEGQQSTPPLGGGALPSQPRNRSQRSSGRSGAS